MSLETKNFFETIDDENNIRLTEKPYVSIQGEGSTVGYPTLFIRTQGCPVGCLYCDSMETWSPFKESNDLVSKNMYDLTLPDLRNLILGVNCKRIWFTGGEPMIWGEKLEKLVMDLFGFKKDYIFTICTSGVIFTKRFWDIVNICLDVKAPSARSMVTSEGAIHYVHNREDGVEYKMVIGDEIDKIYAEKFIYDYCNDTRITLQPKYASTLEWDKEEKGKLTRSLTLPDLADWIVDEFSGNPNVAMGTQFHKEVWPDKLRGI